ncbi:MAG: hypothetical protein ACRC4L_03595 [Mycoplasma sp.]
MYLTLVKLETAIFLKIIDDLISTSICGRTTNEIGKIPNDRYDGIPDTKSEASLLCPIIKYIIININGKNKNDIGPIFVFIKNL